MNTVSDTGFTGVATPGMEKSQIENELGVSTDETLGFSFYQEGIVVEYDENNISTKLVFMLLALCGGTPVMLPQQPPWMKHNEKFLMITAMVIGTCSLSHASVEIDGETFEVVDMHLHTGNFGDFAKNGKSFIMAQLPRFTVISFPGVSATTSNP